MARIRSIHPGLATDETYMSMSMATRAAWPLIWTQCDDRGIFEWKPLVMKARIFPSDSLDFNEVLADLEKLNCIKSFQFDKKRYGVVRNFSKYQRPKKPNSIYPFPAWCGNYTASSSLNSESVPNQSDIGGEIPPQMEDGGDKMEDGGDKKESSAERARTNSELLEFKLREAAGWQNEISKKLSVTGEIAALIEAGADLDVDVLPTVRALSQKAGTRTSWKYFVSAIAQARDDRIRASKIISPERTGHVRNRQNGSSKQNPNSIDAALDSVSAALRAEREALERDEAREAGALGTSRYGFETDAEIIS